MNLFAVEEFDWQPGGFNSEYGDAMSAVSNFHTAFGKNKFRYRFKYETSLVGDEMFDSEYDRLRGSNDYNLGFGGKIPFTGTFANFSTSRVYDQIRQSVAYSDKNVKICASHAGVTLGEDGATHQVLERPYLYRRKGDAKLHDRYRLLHICLTFSYPATLHTQSR